MRCGTCCRKGGPTLHRVDRRLVERGLIPARHLLTIRAGERVFDNLNNRLALSVHEMIKVRGTGDGWTCVYFDADACGCQIYPERPAQCVAQKCWSPAELETLTQEERLTRADLLKDVGDLWDFIAEHGCRCDYAEVSRLAERLCQNPADPETVERVVGMVNYDAAARDLLLERGLADAAMLDFLLGRPLVETLPGFGFRIERRDAGERLSFSCHRYLSLSAP